ncbi:MAG: signal recognition particle-docking protein FtsY [Proteobacteria bacterium]|nr:signal recognition particle-docking protein FtsY [Pseudomonadota bacterium]
MFFKKIKESLSKTHDKLVTGLNHILGRSVIDESLWEELETLLITSDVGVETSSLIIKNLKKQSFKDSEDLKIGLINEITKILSPYARVINNNQAKPYVIMIVGVNGVGKTTTIAKLSKFFINNGKKVVLGAADTFRAAAIEQLEIWANRLGIDIVKQKENADPAAVAFDSLQFAKSKGHDVLIIDTAGRLHTKTNLMEELKKIKRVLQKVSPEYPHETFLVLDATLGQNTINQAKVFNEAINATGIIMTKLDGTAKGGVLINVVNSLKIPVYFVGVGEGIDDLEVFDAKSFAEGLFE